MKRKIKVIELSKNEYACKAVTFWCPGCETDHIVYIEGNVSWDFNCDKYKPTLNPSIKVTSRTLGCCHSFVRDGYIEFLSDCTHKLAGQKVELIDIEDDCE